MVDRFIGLIFVYVLWDLCKFKFLLFRNFLYFIGNKEWIIYLFFFFDFR